MKTRKLGYSDMEFTEIGLGTWAIGGGDNPYGWGPQDDRQSIATIHKAIDLGIKLVPCQMSMDVMEISKEDLIDEAGDVVGVAAFIADAEESEIQLFV